MTKYVTKCKPKTLLMLDLESLDTKPSAVIVSIGAVLFSAKGVAKESFYQPVDIQSCLDAGLTINGSTIAWWMNQSDEARKVFTDKSVPLKTALQRLKNYVYKNCNTYDIMLVANPPRFDASILQNAYQAIGQDSWWKYWDERCYRTWKKIDGVPKIERSGTHHLAVDDAISQAKHAIEINKHLGGILF